MSDVTQILHAIGDDLQQDAAQRLLPLVYQELHRLAAARLANEHAAHSIETSDLVHEAYLRLVGDEPVCFSGRAHFFGAAAEAMRRILIERARKRRTLKRGGNAARVDIDTGSVHAADARDNKLLQLHDALNDLEEHDARKSEIVKLRFFAGLTTREIADTLSLSTATVERDWKFARAWLHRKMDE